MVLLRSWGSSRVCILSPILFAIFIDGLAQALKQVQVGSVLEGTRFNLTLFADDIAILAESRQDLQNLLDAAFDYSESWKFRWNCSGALLSWRSRARSWSFKFLGIDLQQNLSWAGSKARFAAKAKSRLPMITKAVIEGLSIESGQKLWESMVRPTLEYSAEIWGGGNWPQADCIQNAAGRTILGLHRFSAVEVARGELGWLSMQARREIKQLKYWGKLLKMKDVRLPKIVYRQCKNRTARLKGSFCYSIKSILGNLNLGHLWMSEEIGEYSDWVSVVGAAIKRKDTDLWLLAMQEKS